MDFIKEIAKSLWINHRKKFIAIILGLLFAGVAALTGIPVQEIKDAAKDAANSQAPISIPAVVPQPAALPAAPLAAPAEKK